MILNDGDQLVKTFKGYSTSEVALLHNSHTGYFVRKHKNITRNLERIQAVSRNLPVPKIIYHNQEQDYYDMEFIQGLDMKTYLIRNSAGPLIDFIEFSLETLVSTSAENHDYSEIYRKKTEFLLEHCWECKLQFTRDELLKCLPNNIPRSEYLGDLTLENIIYDELRHRFVFIDLSTIDYDSYFFDLAKLRQDLVAKWFIRNDHVYLDNKLKTIYNELSVNYSHAYFGNDYLTILMLLRVLIYATKINPEDEIYLIKQINKLWR